jgi:hypothetical protein
VASVRPERRISFAVIAPYQRLSRSKPALNFSPPRYSTRRQPLAGACSAFGRSSKAARAGERVSDSSSEIRVAAEIVTANWR